MTDAEKAAKAAERRESIFLQALARFLGKKKEELVTIADKETGLAELITIHNESVESIEEQAQALGEATLKGIVIKGLKKLGFTDKIDKFDAALWDKIKEKLTESAEPKEEGGGKADPAEVTTLKSRIKELEGQLKTKDEEHEQAIDELEKTHGADVRMLSVIGLAKGMLGGEKADIPKDEAIAAGKWKNVEREIRSYDWQFNSRSDQWEAYDKTTGKAVREGSQPLTLGNKMHEQVTFNYGRVAPGKGGGSGLPNNKGEGGNNDKNDNAPEFEFKAWKGNVPTSRAEVDKLLDNFSMPGDQLEEISRFSEKYYNTLPETSDAA